MGDERNFPVDSMFTIGINFRERTEKEGGSDDVVRKRESETGRFLSRLTVCTFPADKSSRRDQILKSCFLPPLLLCISSKPNISLRFPPSFPSLAVFPSFLSVYLLSLSFYMDCPSIRFQNSCLKQIISVSEYSCSLFLCIYVFVPVPFSQSVHIPLSPSHRYPPPSHSPHVFDKTLFNRIWQDEKKEPEKNVQGRRRKSV